MVENVSKSEQPFVVAIIDKLAEKYNLTYLDVHLIVTCYFNTVLKVIREVNLDTIDLDQFSKKAFTITAIKLPKFGSFVISKNKVKKYRLKKSNILLKKLRDEISKTTPV